MGFRVAVYLRLSLLRASKKKQLEVIQAEAFKGAGLSVYRRRALAYDEILLGLSILGSFSDYAGL